MARSASSLKSVEDLEIDACSSWLPFTVGQSSSRTRSKHSFGFALYPTTSPRQTKCVHFRWCASARTASSASRLAWMSLKIAKRIAVAVKGYNVTTKTLQRFEYCDDFNASAAPLQEFAGPAGSQVCLREISAG